ncbi:MAG: CHAT domain-containing protein [Anaerolineaceae bacterium]|nr:CHAT domain-containing protein [Anaerolineaceae bacterium]
MSMIDTYRNNIARKRDELVRYQEQRAKKSKVVADQNKKILSVRQSISRTSSSSLISSKTRTIESCLKNISRAETDISKLESNIARKEKEIADEQKKLRREEEREEKKRITEEKKRQRSLGNSLRSIDTELKYHDGLHMDTQRQIAELRNLPRKIKVLFLSSSPIDQDKLRLDEEIRSISEMIRKSEHRDSVELVSAWAVRPLDILQELNIHEPAIVHFSGHGSPNDELVLQDNNGETKLVSKQAIVQAMATTSSGIRLVFLNACYTDQTALSICDHVEAAIGMNNSIGDDAARIFAAQFYSAIGFGKSVNNAFNQAKSALMLENIPEEYIPVLFLQDGVDGEQLIIVSPNNGDESV